MASQDSYTSLGGKKAEFPETAWTRFMDRSQREVVWAELCEKYWRPVYIYLRHRGFNNDQAKDLVQDFFTDKILGSELIYKADKSKGKFRTFLLAAIRNYSIDKMRKSKPTKELDEKLEGTTTSGDSDLEFNREWADELLQIVLQELEQECLKRGKKVHWQIFHDWLLESSSEQVQKKMPDICEKYGVTDANKAYAMIANIKGRFSTILRRQLRTLVNSDAEVDEEIANFLNIFSEHPPRS